jgi:hypothetical protein
MPLERSSLLTLPTICWLAISTVGDSGRDQFTLQVAAFQNREQAQRLMLLLRKAGHNPICNQVELKGRGRWFRIFVGSFRTAAEARLLGKRLVLAGQISDFLVRSPGQLQRPPDESNSKSYSGPEPEGDVHSHDSAIRAGSPIGPKPLPILDSKLDLSAMARRRVPGPDPIARAFKEVLGGDPNKGGGLYLSGDLEEGLARLRWIAGPDAELISIDQAGRVHIDEGMLLRSSGDVWLKVADRIFSNEGLLLLVQLAHSKHRYLLHIGDQAPTLGGKVKIRGSLNLDRNFDRRINPYRPLSKKLAKELPPEGFDSLVAINPAAQWFNLRARRVVPAGSITFHELAEAHAKVELGLEYLPSGSRPGAHNQAVEREIWLELERPQATIPTLGANLVFRSEEDARRFLTSSVQPNGQR